MHTILCVFEQKLKQHRRSFPQAFAEFFRTYNWFETRAATRQEKLMGSSLEKKKIEPRQIPGKIYLPTVNLKSTPDPEVTGTLPERDRQSVTGRLKSVIRGP